MKIRSEAKRDRWQRQLLALAGAVWLSFQATAWSGERPAATPAPYLGDLRAARLMEATLSGQNLGADAAEWQKLETVYADLDAKYPGTEEILNDWAQFRWDLGDWEVAVKKWRAVIGKNPRNDYALSSLGDASLRKGQIRDGATYYLRASESAPTNAAYHFALGNILFLFRKDLTDAEAPDEHAVAQRAIKQFSEAVRLEPLNGEYAKAAADIYYGIQPPEWEAALAAWNHFLEISPQKDFAYVNLARIHLKMGHKAEARACLAQIHSPDFERLKARLTEKIDAL